MTTLVNTLNRSGVEVKEQSIWAIGSILLAALAVNIVPIVTGGMAIYAANKAQSTYLKGLAITATVSGIVLGIIAAL
ncbi:hypothetical protein ACFL57_00765 [Candidatus Margulisiibacteriota bacterium]